MEIIRTFNCVHVYRLAGCWHVACADILADRAQHVDELTQHIRVFSFELIVRKRLNLLHHRMHNIDFDILFHCIVHLHRNNQDDATPAQVSAFAKAQQEI